MIAEFRPSVPIVPDGIHAAAVGISLLQENFVRPGRLFKDGKRRRPVPIYRCPDDPLENRLRFPDILPECLRRHLRNHGVVESVGSDLVSRLGNLFHQGGMIPRDPPEDEKRPPDVIPVEKLQQSCGGFFNAGWEFMPISFRDQIRKRLDLEIFLDIDGESVRNRCCWAFVSHDDRIVIRRPGVTSPRAQGGRF